MTTSDIQKQLAKLRRDKKLLWLGIMFFVVVVLWILSSIFTVTKTSSISPELRNLAKSFVPRLESKVFDEISLKRPFFDEELAAFPIYVFDKNNVDGESTLIDITYFEEVEATEVPAEAPAEEITQATESGTDSGESSVVPSENIVNPQN